MSRLPIPGSDKGTWGDILNNYLSQSHNSDGSLKDGTVTDSTIASTISQSKVANLTTNLAAKANTTDLSPVATTGSYADLANKPTISTGTDASLLTTGTVDNARLPSSAQAATLAADYASTVPAIPQPSKNGIRYDGTDETAAFQALINAAVAFGVGVIELEAVVRCDGQLVIPNSGGTQPRQAPLRITGTVQYMPGSTFGTTTPFPAASGLDLRYAGRTDTGCSTTLGSTLIGNTSAVAGDRGLILTGPGIPDQCWILAVSPGVGYSVTAPARATATVALTTFGGRIQTLGYGNLEIDHIQLMNSGSTASSAPFILSTGTKIDLHHCLVLGHATKADGSCDEDPLVMGGPGQGTMLTSALVSGTVYTTLAVAATPCGTLAGASLILNTGGGTQTVVAPGIIAAGATSITVTSFTANAAYPTRTPLYFGDYQDQQVVGAWSVPSAPFQGYGTRVHDNHFHRIRRIVAGGFTTSVHVDNNSFMHNCGSNLAGAPSTLTTALTSGSVYTSLAVTALSRAAIVGDVIQIGVATSQEVIASAPATVGATSITVTSFTANAAYPTSTVVFNSTNGIGAMVESYALAGSVNAIGVAHNRMGFSGGYTHATRFVGLTQQAVIIDNDFQDTFMGNVIAGHRFDRNAQYNLVIPGLMGSQPTVDDWSVADHVPQQTILEHAQSRPTLFTQGIQIGTSLIVANPALAAFRLTDDLGNSLATISGGGRQWSIDGQVFIDGNSTSGGAATTRLTVGNNSTADDATLTLNPPSGHSAAIQWKSGGANSWLLYDAGSPLLFLRDSVNGVMALAFSPGATNTGVATFSGSVVAGSFIQPQAVATGSRPGAYVGVGAMVYDTTLHKPIWSDGTVWRDATGTAV
jgi:hypothetical protein